MKGFDSMYRKFIPLSLFSKGWGNPSLIQKIIENHKQISKRESCKHLINSFDMKITEQVIGKTSTVVEGSFISPFYKLIPESMDDLNRVARFRLVTPNKWPTKYKPLCILYARTGDHNYMKRKYYLADRLVKDGIASLIHINPYYGSRKPKDQWGSSLNYVSDLFVMGGALILEGQVLLHWATQQGFGPLAIHGISMGGYMASLAAAVYPEPVCLIPCLSGTTASHVYTEGAINQAVHWKTLSHQFNSDTVFSQSIRAQIEPPIPYHLQQFTKKNTADTSLRVDPVLPSIKDTDELKPRNSTDNGMNKFHFLTPDVDNRHILRTLNSDQTKSNNTVDSYSAMTRSFDVMRWFQSTDLLSLRGSVFRRNDVDKNLRTPFFSKLGVDNDTFEFMRDILNYFTHLGNYSIPYDTRLVTAVIADCDKYIPVDGVAQFSDIWNSNIEIEILKGWDHIGSNIGNIIGVHDRFRDAIVRTLNRYIELYHNEPGPFGVKK